MPFRIDKTFVLRAPPSAVWQFLTDPRRVARCMPGAAVTEQLDDKTYAGTLLVKVGPVSASYKGQMTFARLDAQGRSAEIVASGQDVRGKGGATMRLTSKLVERAPDETEVVASSEVNVTGILAQMGRGMVQDVGDQIFARFTDGMRAELEAPAAPARVEAAGAAVPGAPAVAAEAPPLREVAPPVAAPPVEPVDVLSLGAGAAARAASRTLRRPRFWFIAAIVAVLAVLWLITRARR
jgi:carbon monoxide dehydrogenase subunit G